MANVSALIGSGLKVPTNISSLISNPTYAFIYSALLPGAKTLSGALTANTYKELFSISSGGGTLHLAAVCALDTTARTVGLKVVIDGVTAFDQTIGTSAADSGLGIGAAYGSGSAAVPVPLTIPFKTSLSLQVKSSLSETDKVYLKYMVAY